MKGLLWALATAVAVIIFITAGEWATAVVRNQAMTRINQAIAAQDGVKLASGQALLGQDAPERHRNLIGAEFDPDNLLLNGGFEFYAHGWQMGGPTAISRVEPFAGHQAAAAAFDNEDIDFYHSYQRTAVTAEACYRLQAWVRIEGDVNGVALDVWDGPRGYQHWYGGRTPRLSGPIPWTATEMRFCVPADVTEIQIRLRRFGGQGERISGTVWFDEVRLQEE